MFYHTVITRDAKKMLISTQHAALHDAARQQIRPTSRMMRMPMDYTTFFANQDPYNLRLLTILRMNATFPVVLPNVWLPQNR